MIRPFTPEQSPQTTTPSRSSSDSRKSQIRKYVSKGRWWLWAIALVVVIVMIVGILFASHIYYQAMGGQGFLKAKRHEEAASQLKNGTQLYLPMRKVERPVQGNSFWDLIGRAPKNIPYYTCGDQLNSCETFAQPDICCPITMACYPAKFTPSGIACCNSSANQFDCEPSEDNPPTCIKGTVQCPEKMGGGCCPSASECSPNGCIHIVSASILSASPTSTTSSEEVSESDSPISPVTRNSVSASGTPLATVTITQVPAATQTLAKVGEVMQARGSKGSIVMKLCVPHSTAGLLVCVAAMMGLL